MSENSYQRQIERIIARAKQRGKSSEDVAYDLLVLIEDLGSDDLFDVCQALAKVLMGNDGDDEEEGE